MLPKPMTIVVATANEHKLQEMRAIWQNPQYELISAAAAGFHEEIVETGKTFYENALLKAKTVGRATGLPTLADDSGLCVDALHGAPGVYSARYSGGDSAANRRLLLQNLQDQNNRQAHFTCEMVLLFPDGREYHTVGQTFGKILHAEQGDHGFGYDSLFWSDELQKTFAMATADEKNAVSHRGRALQKMMMLL